MIVAAAKSGYLQDEFAKAMPRVQEIPVRLRAQADDHDPPQRRRVGASQRRGFAYPPLVAFVKGAPDVVLDLCTHMLDDGKVGRAHATRCASTILDQNRDMASEALRVLGVAYRPLDAMPTRGEARDRREETSSSWACSA